MSGIPLDEIFGPAGLPEILRAWEVDADQDIVEDVVEDIVSNAFAQYYANYLRRQVVPFAVDHTISQIVNVFEVWLHLAVFLF
jgi:hypothetical protein